MTIMMIFVVVSVILFQLQVETTASSQAFDNNDEITKTSISISGINYTVGSNLVNFTLTNEGSEKLWNYDNFEIFITYDADISGTKTTRTEQFTYDADAFAISNGQQKESPEFNVQHVCTTIPDSSFSVTHTAGTEYTAPSGEAFVRIVDTRLTGNGNTDTGVPPNHQVEDFTVYISDATDLTTQIVFTRNDNPGAEDTRICYEIIDYIGLSDSDNAIKVLDRNVVTYVSGSTTVTGASIAPDDDTDVVVFITGQAGDENGNTQWGETMSTAEWDATNDQPIFTRGQATGSEDDNDLSYAIIEFTGANWNIQRIEHTYSGTGLETATAPTDFTAVGSVSKTFLHTQHISGTDSGLDSQGEEAWLSAVNEISFDLEDSASFGGIVTVVWIIENTQGSGTSLNVQHLSGTISGGAYVPDNPFPISIPISVRAISESAIMGENGRTSGGGTAYPRGAIAFEITAVDTVTGYRSDEGNTQNYRLSVVEFSQAIACAGGTSNNIAINEWTINCIKFDYFEPDVVNPNESPEILTKLQYPLFTNGLLNISVSTDKGISVNQTTTVS